jgi:acetyl-CoA C-acetyltransferase
MASNGIRDRVAIVGMGCTPFGEHWDKSVSDLLVESSQAALNSANVPVDMVDAFWLGTLFSGQSGLTLSRPLKLNYKPVSRLENYCATGSEAFRNACYAIASGAYDVAMAIGVEKLKDSGISSAPPRTARAPASPRPPPSACSRRPTARSSVWTKARSRRR